MKKILLTCLALCGVFGLSAAPIGPDQALSRLYESTGYLPTRGVGDMYLRHTFQQTDGLVSAYVFTPLDGEGFTILSADDLAVPVLGYSDSGVFDVNNMPPALDWWLRQLSEGVKHAEKNGLTSASVKAYSPADMSPLTPLVKTKWNQNAPYNNQTPEVNGKHTYTGCVATSFAQAMKYFNYPERGTKSITYVDGGTRRVMNFTKNFQWDQMLDTYVSGQYTEEQAEAVSYLMKACGFSVEMSYGLNASGAVSYKLANAAVEYFNYDESVTYYDRETFTLDEWTHMIYDNIQKVGPVIYDGQEMAGGHSFICDGYDGNGYFHFNWGWGGMSDGYFLLDALNPESQGIGASEGGFNKGQSALFGLKPKEGNSHYPWGQMKVLGSVTASLNGNNIIFKVSDGSVYTGWGNASYRQVTFKLGAIISRMDGAGDTIDVPGYFLATTGNRNETIFLGESSYYPASAGNPVIEVPALENGDYIVTVAAQDVSQDGAPMLPMMCDNGDINYCYLKVENGVKTVTSASPKKITFETVGFSTPLYYGRNCGLSIEATNNSDIQLTQGYYPALYRNGSVQYVGDYMLITVNPGETTKVEPFTRFSQVANATSAGLGTYSLVLVNSVNNKVIGLYGEYDMTTVSSKLTVTLNDFKVEDASQKSVTVGTKTFDDVYIINDASEININLGYTVVQGYFDSSLRIIAAMYDTTTNKFVNFENDVYSDHPFTGEGATEELNIPFNTDGLKSGVVYRLVAGYVEGNNNKTLGTLYFQYNSSGVDSIIDEPENDAEYYNLQGVRVDKPRSGEIVIKKQGNKTTKLIIR